MRCQAVYPSRYRDVAQYQLDPLGPLYSLLDRGEPPGHMPTCAGESIFRTLFPGWARSAFGVLASPLRTTVHASATAMHACRSARGETAEDTPRRPMAGDASAAAAKSSAALCDSLFTLLKLHIASPSVLAEMHSHRRSCYQAFRYPSHFWLSSS